VAHLGWLGLSSLIFATLIPIGKGLKTVVMITQNGREAVHEGRMSIQTILNDDVDEEMMVIECLDDSGDVREQKYITGVIVRDVYSQTDREAPNGHQSPIDLLPSIHILDFEVPTGMGDIQPGVVSGAKGAAMHSSEPTDAFLQEDFVSQVDPGFVTSNKKDDCEAPVKLETLSMSENGLLEDTSLEDWRGDVRTRSQLRQILGIPEAPSSTTPSTALKPPLSEIDLAPAGADSTLSSPIILPEIEVISEQSEGGRDDDDDFSDIPSDIESEGKKQCERPSRCVESGIDRRYDPTAVQLVNGAYLVPRACERSSHKGNRGTDA